MQQPGHYTNLTATHHFMAIRHPTQLLWYKVPEARVGNDNLAVFACAFQATLFDAFDKVIVQLSEWNFEKQPGHLDFLPRLGILHENQITHQGRVHDMGVTHNPVMQCEPNVLCDMAEAFTLRYVRPGNIQLTQSQ
jgi:hypothetical protein